MDRNNNVFPIQSALLNSLCALIRVVQCADNQTCNCQQPSSCHDLKTLLHHIRTCDKSQECEFTRCAQTIFLMRHYLNCDDATCVCFQLGEKRSENRFYRVIKDILLKNQFLIWRRKMNPFRQHFVNKMTNYLIGFCNDNKETIRGHMNQFLMNFENEQFTRSRGITTYLTTIAQKCSEIQTKIIIQNQQKLNINVVDQEGNMKKIYQMLCLYSTDILYDRMANKILMEQSCIEKAEASEESLQKVYINQDSYMQDDFINQESQIDDDLIKRENKADNTVKIEAVQKIVSFADTSSNSSALTPPKSNPSTKSSPEPCCKPISEFVKVWSRNEIDDMFLGVHRRIWDDKDGEPFMYPVDWKTLCIEDYPLIVTNPMDLSTIRKKLSIGAYENPWQVVNDFWLMFNNAWLYNKKSSKVYKSCTNVAKVFEGLSDKVMRAAGLCCGREYVYLPQVLICCTPKMCTVSRDAIYYCINNDDEADGGKLVPSLSCDKYVCCEKCYSEGNDNTVELMVSESITTLVRVDKSLFTKLKNNIKEKEEFVKCRRCHRQWHRVCARHVDEIWRSGFYCHSCESYRQHPKQTNRFISSNLPHCALSRHIESQIDAWRLKQREQVLKVVVRVLSVSEKTVEVKPEMKKAFVDSGEIADSLPYRLKSIFAFQEQRDGSEVCLFGMQCQEYSSECPYPNSRRVYLAYLDSVHFFEPRQLRTDMYHRLLIAYLDYCRQLGFVFAHIWACPPGDGDDYIFHMHPPTQKLPKSKRLQEWYISMLDLAVKEESVVDYCDIFSYTFSSRLLSISELPYFEGDYWPTVLEDFLKEDSHSIEHFMSLMDEESVQEPMEVVEHPNSKKRKLKKLPNYSKRKRNSDPMDGTSDLTKRLFELIEKRKENFIVVRLHNQVDASKLSPIVDKDPLGFSELMDGRDRFLSLSREKHLEFSSLRRATFATLILCYELHLELRQGVIYSCNHCDMLLDDVRYTCASCDEYELCETCARTQRHEHKLTRLSSRDSDTVRSLDQNLALQVHSTVTNGTMTTNNNEEDNHSSSLSTNSNPDNSIPSDQGRLERAKLLMYLFEHAISCRDANCRKNNCKKLKLMIEHHRQQLCKVGVNSVCKVCDNVMKMYVQHTKICANHSCLLQLCVNKRRNNKTVSASHHQSRLMQLAMERRRINSALVSVTQSTVTDTNGPVTVTEPYKAEMAMICSYIGQLKQDPTMTQERLRSMFQDFLDKNPKYKEAYLDNIQRQKQRQLQAVPHNRVTTSCGTVYQSYLPPQQQQQQQVYPIQQQSHYTTTVNRPSVTPQYTQYYRSQSHQQQQQSPQLLIVQSHPNNAQLFYQHSLPSSSSTTNNPYSQNTHCNYKPS